MDTTGALRRWFQGPGGQLRSASGLLVLLLILVAVHERISSRPRPRVLSWSVSGPGPTPLKDGARPEPVRVTFSDSAAKLEDIGRAVPRGIALSPRARGAWSWANDHELIFTPDEDWPAGRAYEVRFDRGFFPGHVRPESLEGRFVTAPFSAALASAEFHVDPRDPALKRVAATFRFSHPVDADSFERRLSMVMTGQKQGLFDRDRVPHKFTVAYDKFHGEAYAASEPLPVPLEAATMEVAAAAGVKPARGGPATAVPLTASVRVPSMYDYFRVRSARAELVRNERLEPEQVLVVEASGGVGEKEFAAGLKAWVLPPDRPAAPGRPFHKDHPWGDPAEIGPETLARSTAAALTPVPADREHPPVHSFKLRAAPGAALYVKVPRGLVAYGGYVQAKDFDAVVRLPAYPREIKILHEGALLRLSGEKKLSLYSLGERAVRLEAGRVRPSRLNDLASQTEGDFSNPAFRGWSFGQDNITERFEEVRRFGRVEADRLHFFAFDFTPHLQSPASGSRNGLFFLRAEGWDPERGRATGPADTRFILITDLGVLVKENADSTRDVFVQSLASGEPVAGARVEVVGVNGLPVASAATDASGRARLPDLTGFKRERAPAAFVVRSGEDLSFLPFDRRDRRLDVSRFDVGGDTTQGRERELSAFLFSDRGLYRPGEAFHAGIIVRPTAWGQDLAGVPIEISVLDPRGLEVKKFKRPLTAAGFETVDYQTQENGLTGSYAVSAYIVRDGRRGALLGSTAVRVEEFLPDRLRITARFSRERTEGWVSPKDLKAAISLHNLFGAPAEGRRVSGRIRLSPAAPSFKAFAGYDFF
ncbi:MAG: MG2 domain-containing protein, partial [Elusimicrobia bacterium]|nr:MG2 domain-containing protein [Elusimicrobiota bacterium]